MANNKALDLIAKSLERAHDKLDQLDNIKAELHSSKETLLAHIGSESNLVNEQKLIRQTLDRNTASLEEHVRRTELLEKTVSSLDGRIMPIEKEFLHKRAVEMFFSKIGKWMGAIFALAGAVATLLKVFL